MNVNWDDDDLKRPNVPSDDDDYLFEFTQSLRLEDDEDSSGQEELDPLPEGTVDASGDRGVLIKRMRGPNEGSSCPSKAEPFVELHYNTFLIATGEKIDSSRDQNYPLVVQLDIPPSGNSTVMLGWEIALGTLKAGEIADVTIRSKYAYGKEGKPPDVPADADLRCEIEILDVRSTQRKTIVEDVTEQDLSRLEEARRDREKARLRREERSELKEMEMKAKPDRAALLREKLANKHKGGGKKGGKKTGKKKK